MFCCCCCVTVVIVVMSLTRWTLSLTKCFDSKDNFGWLSSSAKMIYICFTLNCFTQHLNLCNGVRFGTLFLSLLSLLNKELFLFLSMAWVVLQFLVIHQQTLLLKVHRPSKHFLRSLFLSSWTHQEEEGGRKKDEETGRKKEFTLLNLGLCILSFFSPFTSSFLFFFRLLFSMEFRVQMKEVCFVPCVYSIHVTPIVSYAKSDADAWAHFSSCSVSCIQWNVIKRT